MVQQQLQLDRDSDCQIKSESLNMADKREEPEMTLVKVWGKGQLTIPASIRKELNLKEETPLTLVKVGNVILMTPKVLQVDALAKKARKEIKKAGLTVDDIMADLDSERDRYNKDRYGT